ncbi:MAG: YafY family protein [Myxococcota bacterium]
MRRADRLFQLVQLLRGRRLSTAQWLADELGVSTRTVYRDIADLARSGVPVRGEAGVGYALEHGFELPPLTFNHAEIEALVLGARMVEAWADPELRDAARAVLAKVDAVLPATLRETLAATALFAPHTRDWRVPDHLADLRRAVTEHREVRFAYTSGKGLVSERTVQPVGLHFWGRTWSLAAWCGLRDTWRGFRIDRMREVSVLDESFDPSERGGLEAYLRHMQTEADEEGWTLPGGLG